MATYSFIAAEKAEAQEQDQGLSIAQYCKTLEVSRSGFYDWAKRGPCERDLYDGQLSVEIEAIYIASNRT